MKTIYDLEILEELKIPSKFDKEVFVMRVPGGWMFTTVVTTVEEEHNSERVSTVFVPLTGEETPKKKLAGPGSSSIA